MLSILKISYPRFIDVIVKICLVLSLGMCSFSAVMVSELNL